MKTKLTHSYINILRFLYIDRRFIGVFLLVIAELMLFCALNCEADASTYTAYLEQTTPLYPSAFAHILFENLKSMALTVFSGLIPFFGGALFMGFGTVYSLFSVGKAVLLQMPADAMFLALLPHGIFEIPAILFSLLLAAMLSKEVTLLLVCMITDRDFRSRRALLIRRGLLPTLRFCLRGLVFVILPLMLLGALAESTVSLAMLSNLR